MIPSRALSLAVCLFSHGVAAAPGVAAPPAPPAIAWRSFDAEAFREAKEKGHLVLLSIQAPWGHWDRLMSELTFSDPNVVKLINEKFVAVRVDPLLRPDVWGRYGMGGWPTTAFLLPSGLQFHFPDAARNVIRAGGTYYAAEPLRAYLEQIAEYYAANRDQAEKAVRSIADSVLARKEVKAEPLNPELLEAAVTRMLEEYRVWNPDPASKAYRTPDADSIELAFTYWYKKNAREVLDAALHLLTDMARGGIHDQLGGGFHRLASDAAWRVPAFEKLLGVNAEMVLAYADAYMVTGMPRYRELSVITARYVLDTLTDPAGWFYAYQAAESRLGEDGDYYTWTLDEARAALTEEEQALVLPSFDIGEWGEMVNSAPRRNVLYVSEGPQLLAERLGMDRARVVEILERGTSKLRAARAKRQAPPVGKILVSEAAAAMSAALIQSGDLLMRPELTRAGLRGLDALWDKTIDPNSGLVDHAWSPETGRAGLAEFFSDQAQMARALLAAYESTGETRYLERAEALAGAADTAFKDSLSGGWMDRIWEADAPGLLSWPTRSIHDNSVFAEVLLRLSHLSRAGRSDQWSRTARKGLESWADEFANYKRLSAPFGTATDKALSPPLEVLVVGDAGSAAGGDASGERNDDYASVDRLARSLYHPWRLVRHVSARTGGSELTARKLAAPTGPACFFCLPSRCAGPYTTGNKIRAKFDEFIAADRGKPAAKPAEAKDGEP